MHLSRKVLACFIVGMFLAIVPAFGATQDDAIFEATDVYFQARDGHKPHHFCDGNEPEELSIFLGNDFRLWTTLEVREGMTSPCTDRDEEGCSMHFGFVQKNKDGTDGRISVAKMYDEDFRINNDEALKISLGCPISRSFPKGSAEIVLLFKHGDKVLLRYSIPVEIR